jgi:hypothetical protein
MIPSLIMPVLVTLIILAITMLFLVTRHVLAMVPTVLHKEDPLTASIVFTAVPAPIFDVPRGDSQIDRRAPPWHSLDCYRLTIEYLWWRIATDVESAIEAGLADAD